MATDLTGKTILITGASRGVGAACARLAVQQGARVLCHARGPSDQASALMRDLGDQGTEFLFEDLSLPGAGARLIARASEHARLDGLVNNAGIYLPSPLTGEIDEWDSGWQQTIATNVQAVADSCRSVIAHFRDHGGGTIVNVASRAGHRGDGVEHAAYAASKAAVLAMTKTWARGLAGENIHLYAIAPGWIETRMAPRDIAARAAAVSEIPLGKVAQPEEVAEMILFLMSGACPSAIGATFDINGASYVR